MRQKTKAKMNNTKQSWSQDLHTHTHTHTEAGRMLNSQRVVHAIDLIWPLESCDPASLAGSLPRNLVSLHELFPTRRRGNGRRLAAGPGLPPGCGQDVSRCAAGCAARRLAGCTLPNIVFPAYIFPFSACLCALVSKIHGSFSRGLVLLVLPVLPVLRPLTHLVTKKYFSTWVRCVFVLFVCHALHN